jgi:hypothetical protein
MKKCLSSLTIKEIQIKTTLRFHFTSFRIVIMKSTTKTKCWWGCGGKKKSSYTTGRNESKYNHFEIQYGDSLKNYYLDLPYDPAIPLLGIYPKECNSGYYKGTYTPIFIAALFTIAKLWKQPRSPTAEEWIKKMCYLYTMEFYSVTKKNEILSFANKWMQLENIFLREVSQAQKAKHHMFSLICRL